MITKNKPALKTRITRALSISKQHLKPMLAITFFICVFSIVGSMDYQDEVLQHQTNCKSATYSNDNGGC